MPNMSYCRFQNTLQDLHDCAEAAGEFDTADALFASLSDNEAKAARNLLQLCRNFADEYEIESVA